MVVSKDTKRKRKEAPVAEATPEIPKRTKVQAQRKFAQGQGTSSSYATPSAASTAATSSSQPGTPVKEGKEPPELITHKRPRTEDFLTFLCYRGTSVLPSHLDFLNQNKNNKTDEASTAAAGELATSSTPLDAPGESVKVDAKQSVDKNEDVLVSDTPTPKKEPKTEIMPFAVRKRADQVVEGNRLRDRIKKEEMNRRSPRTRGHGKAEIDTEYNSINDTPESMCDENETEKETPVKTPDAKKEQKPQLKQKRKYTKQNNEECADSKLAAEAQKEESNDKESKSVDKVNEKAADSPVIGETKKAGRGRKKANETIVVENVGRMTRQRAFFEPVKVFPKEPEPEIELENEPKIDPEIKPKIKPVQIETEKKVEKVDDSKCDEKSEFSSDDEQPLAKSMKIVKEKNKKKFGKKLQKNLETIIPDEKPKPEESPPIPTQTPPKPGRGRRPKKAVEPSVETIDLQPEVLPKASNKEAKRTPVKRSKELDLQSEPEGSTSASPPKAKAEKKAENDQFSQQSHTDLSEHETKSGRPMRKTKEAATIYMELIGQKLNLEEFEEDNESIDSFPELPNAKKTEKMENELKLKVGQPTKAKNNAGRKKMKKEVEEIQLKNEEIEKEQGEQKKFDDGRTVNKAGVRIKKGSEEKDMSINKFSLGDYGLLEKSFDDSDDEPLATKIVKPAVDVVKSEPLPVEIKTESSLEIKETLAPPIIIEEKPPVPPVQLPIVEQPRPFSDHKPIQRISSPSKFQPNKQPNRIMNPVPKPSSPTHLPTPSLERFPSPKVNPTFLTPKFDRSIERRIPPDPIIPPPSFTRSILTPSSSIRAEITGSSPSPLNSTNNSKKYEADSFLSANLMPSKEESGKIFGIASVSLAQSSGPDNTKCTLGKCGSIHKPVLGPVVPTEAYLGEQLSSKDRRKAKVNMTHEQIQKWLTECSSNPDEIQDDLDDDFDDNLKPMTFAPSPTLLREERDLASGTSSKASKETLKSENVWSGRGPSLKATAIVAKDEVKSSEKPASYEKRDVEEFDKKSLEKVSVNKMQHKSSKIEKDESTMESGKVSQSKQTSEIVKSPKPSTSSTATSSPKHQKSPRTSNPIQKNQIQKNQSQKLATQKEQNQQPKSTGASKGPKRQPVYTAKLSESLKKKNPATNSFSAFSPENETSVYSFDKEDDVVPPLAKPFRRHSRRESNTEENSQSEKPTKNEKPEKSEKGEKTPCKDQQVNNSISLTLSPEENSKLIKVSLDGAEKIEEKKSSTAKQEKPTKNEPGALGDSDSECHTFYIPLQATGAAGNVSGKSSDVIQGVAVKLGREGPDGPNQRVVMHATLVTKAQMGSNTAPLPESMNVHEIVKNLLSSTSKESTTTPAPAPAAPSCNAAASKSVPVGTVQPRFKSNSDTQNASGSGLTRVNSNSSLFSGSNKSRPTSAKKVKDVTPIKMCNNTAFPRRDDPSQMVEAPVFRPTEKEFADPMEFIERITPIAARFGICKIIPPDSFKPECRVSDDMRFTAYNQYIHKMLHRWGPNAKELSAIKKYLTTQSIAMAHPPWIGGMEIDLPRLYHTVQQLGGLKEVIEKKKWAKVAEEMCIPKLAQDRATKLDDIYCKYLLPYDTLSPAEREKLFDEVEADWLKKESRARRNADRCVNPESVSNEEDEASSEDEEESEEDNDAVSMECIVKGRSMPLNQFFRIARNTMAMWFKNSEPTVGDIESEFWRLVSTRENHVCVNSGSIDSSGWGYGFPTPGPKTKGCPCARHPWNLKVLTNNSGSVLRSLGPVMGVTVPTLHVGMLFSCCCWYRDPHGLSWIEYLHTGANKIWYGIPDEQSSNFRSTLTSLIPTHCQNKTIWLPCDTAMVPPHVLTDRSVSLCRTVQKPGEFVVMFPRAYTSSMATGYVVSESVYFATSSWLESAKEDFKDIHESCEPAMFSLEQLLFAIASDQRVSAEILSQILPMITEVYDKEVAARQQLKASGVTMTEKIPQPPTGKAKKYQTSEEYECDLCRANLYISMVKTEEGNIYCMQHALKNINNGNVQAKQCKLIFAYNIEDIESLLKKLKDRLAQQKKKSSNGNSKKSQK